MSDDDLVAVGLTLDGDVDRVADTCFFDVDGFELTLTDVTSVFSGASLEDQLVPLGFETVDAPRPVWTEAGQRQTFVDVGGRIVLLSVGFGTYPDDLGDLLAALGVAIANNA